MMIDNPCRPAPLPLYPNTSLWLLCGQRANAHNPPPKRKTKTPYLKPPPGISPGRHASPMQLLPPATPPLPSVALDLVASRAS